MGFDRRGIELYADVSLEDAVSLRSQARASDMAEFTWAEGTREFAITISQETLREFVRQSTLMIAALDHFKKLENSDDDYEKECAEYRVSQGEPGRTLTRTPRQPRHAYFSPRAVVTVTRARGGITRKAGVP